MNLKTFHTIFFFCLYGFQEPALLEADLSPCLINQLKTNKQQKNNNNKKADNPKLDKENGSLIALGKQRKTARLIWES